MSKLSLAISFIVLCTACKHAAEHKSVLEKPAPKTYDAISRSEFNFRAAREFLPLFWRADKNDNKSIDPDELAVIWHPNALSLKDYVSNGVFNNRFNAAYETLTSEWKPENTRQELLAVELEQGKPTLVELDTIGLGESDLALVRNMRDIGLLIEQIYAKQLGTAQLAAKIPMQDKLSRAVFYRNQRPECVAPKTEKNEACNALTVKEKVYSGMYPRELQEKNPKFCEAFGKETDPANSLSEHFKIFDGTNQVPYTTAYAEEMKKISTLLQASAALLDDKEAAFKAYLLAASQSFLTNDWEPANQAWVNMSATNSRWYLRVGPDESYFEPCSIRAGFALVFARINRDSLEWQKKLDPVKQQMEVALAKFAGPPYKARNVAFKLPDFIDIVLNAGDSRNPHGATVGQSLPNWGAVAGKGGRTVAMTNLYTDSDSQAILKDQMASLFCKDTIGFASVEQKPILVSTLLHEAAHNLGPSHEYRVGGKTDSAAFGGTLASMLEELKAQTAALYFAEFLKDKKIIDAKLANESAVRDIAWAFGHISRGMYESDGHPKAYSQLASIQLGTFTKDKTLVFNAEEMSANDKDKGCFSLKMPKWKKSVEMLASQVLKVKSKGDKAAAEKLKATFVDQDGDWKKLREIITERWLRAPKATFVYSFNE